MLGSLSPPPAATAPLPPGPGEPLEPGIRAEFETRLEEPLDTIRVHDGAGAAEAAKAHASRAYTIGEHIVLGGHQNVAEDSSKELLAHEIAHVIQQRRGGGPPPSPLGDANLESAANRTAANIAHGTGHVTVSGTSATGIARQTAPNSADMRNPRTMDDVQLKTAYNRLWEWINQKESRTHLDYQKVMDHFQAVDRELAARRLTLEALQEDKEAQAQKKGEAPKKPAEPTRTAMPQGEDYTAHADYIDNIDHASYDVGSGEFWLIYKDGKRVKMDYAKLLKQLGPKEEKAEGEAEAAIEERARKALEKAEKVTGEKYELQPGVRSVGGVARFWRDKASGKIVPNDFSEKTTPNLADAVRQVEEARGDAELLQQLGQQLLDIPIMGPRGGPPKLGRGPRLGGGKGGAGKKPPAVRTPPSKAAPKATPKAPSKAGTPPKPDAAAKPQPARPAAPKQPPPSNSKPSAPAKRKHKDAPATGTKKGYQSHDPGSPEISRRKGPGGMTDPKKVDPGTAQKLGKQTEAGQTQARSEAELRPGVRRRTTTVAQQGQAGKNVRLVTPKEIDAHVADMNKKGVNFKFGSKRLQGHAEVKQAIARPNQPVSVSQAPCKSCQRFFSAEAKYQGRTQQISDPDRTWFFEPDGSVWTRQH
jgi:hypothetical protein